MKRNTIILSMFVIVPLALLLIISVVFKQYIDKEVKKTERELGLIKEKHNDLSSSVKDVKRNLRNSTKYQQVNAPYHGNEITSSVSYDNEDTHHNSDEESAVSEVKVIKELTIEEEKEYWDAKNRKMVDSFMNVFEEEERDFEWSITAEDSLRNEAVKVLGDAAYIEHADCRSTLCYTRIKGADITSMDKIKRNINAIIPWANSQFWIVDEADKLVIHSYFTRDGLPYPDPDWNE